MSFFQIKRKTPQWTRETSDIRLTRYTWKCARKGNDFFSLSKRRILNSFCPDEWRCKKKLNECACFKWPEVAACLLNRYQSHSPSSSTSTGSDGDLRSTRTPWIRTRSSVPERGKKSFLGSCTQICYIPWRGNRSVSPFFSFSSLKNAQRHSCGTWACKTKLNRSYNLWG